MLFLCACIFIVVSQRLFASNVCHTCSCMLRAWCTRSLWLPLRVLHTKYGPPPALCVRTVKHANLSLLHFILFMQITWCEMVLPAGAASPPHHP